MGFLAFIKTLLHRYLSSIPTGKTFLITGASKGIGKAIAMELAKHGKTIILVSRNEKLLLQVQQEILAKYMKSNVYIIPFDVTSFDRYDELFELGTKIAGSIDSIICNAGVLGIHGIGTDDAFDKDVQIFETNLLAPISCINSFVRYCRRLNIKNPHIVAITSLSTEFIEPQKGAYCSSKVALGAYLESCLIELEPEGFWFTNIKPGLTDTEMANIASKEVSFLKVSAEYCAKHSVSAIFKRKYNSFVPNYLVYPIGTCY
eukprot:NODE_292_length_11597_cov_0.265177.p5 type:complete len:260 gc:universal NODE_292_length_11597_cov_0.265177:2138-1359(-)